MQQTNELLEKNLESISKKSPGLAEKIRNHVANDVDFVYAKSQDIVMVYKGIPLHSMDAPIQEAKNTYDTVKDKGYKSFNVIFGLGLGYLFKRATMETKGSIVVFEPNMDVLRATLEVVDFSEEFKRDNIWIVNELIPLKAIFMLNFYSGDFVGVQMLTSYRVLYPEILQELTQLLSDMYRDSLINQHTVLNKAKIWSLAALNNIFDLVKYPNMTILEDRLEGIPAVIVSAGPSLEYAIDKLRDIQDKVLIVVVGQALKALDKAGIKPHIVAVIENLNVSQQFEGVSYLNDLTVVLQPMTHRAIYKLPVKRFFINFPLSDNIAKWYGRSLKRDVKGFPNRGTVSIMAYYIAQNAGCSPLILVGQNLAYNDGKCYADNTSYEAVKYNVDDNGRVSYTYNEETYETFGKTFEVSKEEFLKRNFQNQRETIKVPGWNGEELLSTASYSVFINNYIDIAETELPKTNQRLINSSVGGAYIKGLEHLSFEEALQQCDLNHNININALIDQVFEEFKIKPEDYEKLYKTLKTTQKELLEVRNISSKAIETSDTLFKELEKPKINALYIDKLISKLGKSDKSIIEIVKRNELINPFIQKELFDYSSTYDRQVQREDQEDKIENLKINLNQSVKLYKAVISGSDQINDILPEVFEENSAILKSLTT